MTSIRKQIMVVGDGNTGKTCMLHVFKERIFFKDHVPTVVDSFVKKQQVEIKNKSYEMELTMMDSAGEEEYVGLRALCYPKVDALVLVYSVADPVSLTNIKHNWYPEIKHYCPNKPLVLVGNKNDLREDAATLLNLKQRKEKPVFTDDGIDMAKKIGAKFMECSAMKNRNIDEVFLEAARLALEPEVVRKRICKVL